jgi:probable phosphoglycerate mutase
MPTTVTWQRPHRRRIYLMRHGAVSYFDPAREVPLHPNQVPLNEEGRRQAEAARDALADVSLDRVICSGLPRTEETAQLVQGSRSLKIEIRPEFREIEPGNVMGISLEDAQTVFAEALRGELTPNRQFLHGETFGQLQDRVLSGFHELLTDPAWQHMLIVAHGIANRALLTDALGAGLDGFRHLEQDAACINVIDVDAQGDLIVRGINITPYNLVKSGIDLTTMEQLFVEFVRLMTGGPPLES